MTEIDRIHAAIFRYEARLAEMSRALGPDQCPCCVGAAYGGTAGRYCQLEEKLERTQAWLDVLRAKQYEDAATPLPRWLSAANERYAELTKRR